MKTRDCTNCHFSEFEVSHPGLFVCRKGHKPQFYMDDKTWKRKCADFLEWKPCYCRECGEQVRSKHEDKQRLCYACEKLMRESEETK